MSEDIIGLWKLHKGISDDREAFEGLYSYFNITVDQYQKQAKNEQYTATTIHTNAYTQQAEQAPTDFTDFYLQAYSNIEATDYWRQRGLSKGIVDRFRLGYVAEWKHPKAPAITAPTPRLIIPITKYSYLARDIRQQIPPEQEDYKKSKVKGAERVSWTYNSKALKTASKPIFIVEGELDALSLIEVGAEAIALGSIAYIRAFIELVKKIRPSQPLLIALDNETEPEKQARIDQAATDLEAGFKELELPYYRLEPAQVAGQHKDANEALVADRKTFEARVNAIYQSIQQEQEAALEAEKQAYLNTSTANYLQDFINGIAESVNTPYTPTGFTNLSIEIVNILCFVFLGLLLMLIIYLQVLKPLSEVQHHVRDYANSKDSGIMVNEMQKITSRNEIGRLADDLSSLAVELDHYTNETAKLSAEKAKLDSELSFAASIQQDALPKDFSNIKGFQLFAFLKPAKEVGGDLYDFFMIDDDHILLAVGDVSGKGISAALFMMRVKTMLKDAALLTHSSPREIITNVNAMLCEDNDAMMFVTLWLGIMTISTGEIVYVNAGHEYPLVKDSGGKFKINDSAHSTPLAINPRAKFSEGRITLAHGDALFVYTDGIPEAINEHEEQFGVERLADALNENPENTPQELADSLLERLNNFAGSAPQFDDITILCVKY